MCPLRAAQDAAVELVAQLPPPGHIVSRTEQPELQATELLLSNGMRVWNVLHGRFGSSVQSR